MTENQHDQPQEEIKKEESPWQNIGIGLIMIAGAVFIYHTFDNMEKEGGSIRINWIFALIYKFGGKWPGPILIALIGAFTTYGGIKDLMNKKKI